MNANEIYFQRNRGSWDWQMDFRVSSYRRLWKSQLSLLNKIRMSAFALAQTFLGPFEMWTHIDIPQGSPSVQHSTRMTKWGFLFYRSEKTFLLDDDGFGIRLEGVEYFWPLEFKAVPFSPSRGVVDSSTTRASYQMPLAGTACECQAYLGPSEGYIDVATPWLKGRFTLIESSRKVLESRFNVESVSTQ